MGEVSRSPERIVVALDGSEASLAALRTAVHLAARLPAPLEGLFVEDADLLRAVSLPGSRLVQMPTGSSRDVHADVALGELRAVGDIARSALADAAKRASITWTFRVSRGPVTAEIVAASRPGALLVLGRRGRTFGDRRLGRTARNVASRSLGSVLVVGDRGSVPSAVMVVADATPGGVRAQAAARRISEATGMPLGVAELGSARLRGALSDPQMLVVVSAGEALLEGSASAVLLVRGKETP